MRGNAMPELCMAGLIAGLFAFAAAVRFMYIFLQWHAELLLACRVAIFAVHNVAGLGAAAEKLGWAPKHGALHPINAANPTDLGAELVGGKVERHVGAGRRAGLTGRGGMGGGGGFP